MNKIDKNGGVYFCLQCACKQAAVVEKRRQTCLEKYGVDNPMKCDELIEKQRCNVDADGVPYSKQQLALFNMLKSQYQHIYFNVPSGKYFLDIVLEVDDIKIDIEYDGWYWHQLNNIKDTIRDNLMLLRGYKILRIKSGHLLPSFEQLNTAINNLLNTTNQTLEIILEDWK